MENLNILITEETMKALKKKAIEEKRPIYDIAQQILAEATHTKCIFFEEHKMTIKNN